MFTTMIVFHTIVCIMLIIVILMQSSKGEGLAGAFGGGALSGAVFGGRGAAGFLSKATSVLAIVFMINCGILAVLSAHRTGSAPATATDTPTSVVTEQAQRELEEQAARQQMIPPADTTGGDVFNIEGTQPATTGQPETAPSTTPSTSTTPPTGTSGDNK